MDSLLGRLDCEDLRDFAQYYRGRYFGWAVDGATRAATLDRHSRAPDRSSITVYNAGTKSLEQLDVPWATLQVQGRFGLPILGNVPFGPTFLYASTAPRRESAKGLHLPSCQFRMPQHGGLSDKLDDLSLLLWGPEQDVLRGALRGEVFGTAEERELVHSIYNREYPTPDAAVHELERGTKIGVPISHRLGLYLVGGKENIQLRFATTSIGELIPAGRRYRTMLNGEQEYLRPVVNKLLGEGFNE